MTVALTVIHILVCFVLVAVVLLQRGKGAEMGAVFGGGASSTVFGSRGAGTFLSKLTTGCAVVFMLTSLSLSYLHGLDSSEQLFQEGLTEAEEPAGGEFEQFGTVAPEDPSSADSAVGSEASSGTAEDSATGDF